MPETNALLKSAEKMRKRMYTIQFSEKQLADLQDFLGQTVGPDHPFWTEAVQLINAVHEGIERRRYEVSGGVATEVALSHGSRKPTDNPLIDGAKKMAATARRAGR